MGNDVLTNCNVNFAKRLDDFGELPAVISASGSSLSYASLAKRADEFAESIGGGRRLIMIEAVNELEPLIAYLGALRHNHPVLMVQAGHLGNPALIDAYRPYTVVSKQDGGWVLSFFRNNQVELHPDLAVLFSTSGSSGTRKFVRLSHDAINANAKAIAEFLDIASEDRAVANLSIQYAFGHSVVSSNLTMGACLLLTEASVIDPEFWTFFKDNQATSLAGVPYTFDLLERVGFRDMDLPSLNCLIEAGGKLKPELALRYTDWAQARRVRFYLMYGQTEATARMAYLPPELVAAHPDSIGRPIPGGRFKLVDSDGALVTKPGVEGELVYAGANVMLGYAESAADLAKGREIDELKTGDLATCDDQGLYRITGRISRIIKPFGVRIVLDEIESILAASGHRALATGDDKTLVVALLESAPNEAVENVVRGDLEQRLGLPRTAIEVVSIREPPLLASGKIDYPSILHMVHHHPAGEGLSSPADGGSGVVQAFERAFPGTIVRPEDTFATLGGDSMSYVGLSLDLEGYIKRLPSRWEALTVGQLQALAAEAGATKAKWWSPVRMESEVLIRAMAIMAVVANHAVLAPVSGGANALLVLAGYSLGRSNFQRLTEDRSLSILGPLIRRMIIPYYFIMVAFLVYTKKPDIESLLLVGNWAGRLQYLNSYWFLEFLLQSTLLICLAFKIPFVRNRAKADPWSSGLVVLILSIALRIGVYVGVHKHTVYLEDRTQDALFYLMALGWLINFADTMGRKLLLTAFALALGALDWFGCYGLWFMDEYPRTVTHAVLLAFSTLLMVWVGSIPIPKILRTAIGAVAAASYYIYITMPVTLHLALRMNNYVPLFGWLAAILMGLLVWMVFNWTERSVLPFASRFISGRDRPQAALP